MAERAQTPEAVALDLVSRILGHENQEQTADKDMMLSLYAECLRVVNGGAYEPSAKSKNDNARNVHKSDAQKKQEVIREYQENEDRIKAQAS